MDLVEQYRALARYNRWMNRKVYAACAELGNAERRRDRGAFFRSIHDMLNHLLLTDRVQLGRFLGPEGALSLDDDGRPIEILSLDQILYDDFEQLRREREATDAAIFAFVDTLTLDRLSRPFRYRAMVDDREHEHVLWWAVMHFFNHQTHHRGQVTAMLSQAGLDVGSTDLMTMLRSEPAEPGREAEPRAYMLVEIEVLDPVAYAEYVERVPATVARYGGRYVVRGGAPVPLTGDWRPERIILLEFPSAERMAEWNASPEYQALAPIRIRSTRTRAIALEGCGG